MKNKLTTILMISIFLLTSVITLPASKIYNFEAKSVDNETEYWGLLIAVGEYYNHPDENRPSMLQAIEELRTTLLSSEKWDADHIKTIKAEEATMINIIRGFFWLDRMEDRNDISLVWISTHGFPLEDQNGKGLDLPPFDEEDGCDEALVTYYGFEYTLAAIWDDLLNFLLNRLESEGVCLMVDSCYSGGFNDKPIKNNVEDQSTNFAQEFIQDFSDGLLGQNRIVLMSSEEDTLSWGSTFSYYVIEGLQGIGDTNGNNDDIVSAEEAFYYARPLVENASYQRQRPTILDLYPGELPLTYYQTLDIKK